MREEDFQRSSKEAMAAYSSSSLDATTDTVPFRSAAFDDDAKAIDIHIDEDRNPFQASQSQPSASLDTSLDAQASGSLSGRDVETATLSDEAIWFAPARIVQDICGSLDGHSNSSAIGCVDYIVREQPASLQKDDRQLQNNVGTSASLETGSDPASTLSQSKNDSCNTFAMQTDFEAALPHPHAIFQANNLEWRVLLREDKDDDGSISFLPPPCDGDASLHLWRKLDPKDTSTKATAVRIPTLSLAGDAENDKGQEYVASFDSYLCTNGSVVHSTQRGTLPSIIPKELLTTLRDSRKDNPRPGVTGVQQFQDAVVTLTRIVGNAANGEMRGFSVTSKLINQKLGLDATSVAILKVLGFRVRINEADGVEQWFPPPPTLPLHRRRLLRATTELVLWYGHECISQWIPSPQSIEAQWTTTRVLPKLRSCTALVASLFDHENHHVRSNSLRTTPADLRTALLRLGAVEGCTDVVVDYCYLCNSDLMSPSGRQKLFRALADVAEHPTYRDSDLLETRIAIEKSRGLVTWQELKKAYREFNIEADDADEAAGYHNDVILDLFTNAANAAAADTSRVARLKEALEVISSSRSDPSPLRAALTQTFSLDFDRACTMLEVKSDTDDDFIGSAYQMAVLDARHAPNECQEALRVIAEHRQSPHLRRLYREVTGQDTGWEAPASDLPAGLNNIGNTCYLNSVLQYFFAIKPLRERVLEAGRGSQASSDSATSFRVAGRRITKREVERSMRFVLELAQLFSAMISSPVTAVTPERDLAYLALVSSRWEDDEVSSVPQTSNASGAANSSGAQDAGQLVQEPQQMSTNEAEHNIVDETSAPQKVEERSSAHVTFASPPSLPPRPQEGQSYHAAEIGQRRNSLMQLGAQQDVSECLENVTTQVETALTAQPWAVDDKDALQEASQVSDDAEWAPESDVLRRLFLGRTCQRVEVDDTANTRTPSVHVKREVFKTLPVDVLEEGRDIYDGLDGFFDEETLQGPDGKSMLRTVTLTDAPAVLQIQLQRVQFDRVRGVFKSQANLKMGEELYMDRYLDFNANDPQDSQRLAKRKRSREIRRTVAALRERIQTLRPTSASVASKALSRTSDLLASLRTAKRPRIELEISDSEDSLAGYAESPGQMDEIDDSFGAFLTAESQAIESEIHLAETRLAELKAEVEVLWADERRVGYVLASVFMHRGEASHGHYFLNQRKLSVVDGAAAQAQSVADPAAPSTWFKYNDNVVETIPVSQVLQDTTGATPYLVSFVRKDMQEKVGIFDTVCRLIDNGAAQKQGGEGLAQQGLDVNMTVAVTGEGSQDHLHPSEGGVDDMET